MHRLSLKPPVHVFVEACKGVSWFPPCRAEGASCASGHRPGGHRDEAGLPPHGLQHRHRLRDAHAGLSSMFWMREAQDPRRCHIPGCDGSHGRFEVCFGGRNLTWMSSMSFLAACTGHFQCAQPSLQLSTCSLNAARNCTALPEPDDWRIAVERCIMALSEAKSNPQRASFAFRMASQLLLPSQIFDPFVIDWVKNHLEEIQKNEFFTPNDLADFLAEKMYRALKLSRDVVRTSLKRPPDSAIQKVLVIYGQGLIV